MRYIGGKSLLLDKIYKVITDNTQDVCSVLDLFSGSGVVSAFLKEKGYNVVANDFIYFAYVLSRGTLNLNSEPTFEGLKAKGITDVLAYLNNLSLEQSGYALQDCFVYNTFSPTEVCQRMYLQNHNAIKIDLIRQRIEEWKDAHTITDDEYYYLLASLISAVPYVSNIAGVYGAYLKHWDKRTYKSLLLEPLRIIQNQTLCQSYNKSAQQLVREINTDLVYLDPPYNARQYLPNYHVLETIAKYDNPEVRGVSGMRDYSNQKSAFCMKSKAAYALELLVRDIKARYIVMSYNNEGIISTAEITAIMKAYAKPDSFRLYEFPYRRYKSKIPNVAEGLEEQLYFIEKR